MKPGKVRQMNIHYALLQSLEWSGHASIWGCMTVLLLYLGFRNSQIGVVSSAALLLPIVVQPLLASLADRYPRITSRALAAAMAALGVLTAAGLWIGQSDRTAVVILYLLTGLALISMPPFFNAMAMEYVTRGVALNYGLGRGIGSGMYAVAILALGRLLEHHAPTLVIPVYGVLWAALLAAILLFRYPLPEQQVHVSRTDAAVLSIPQLLRRYPRFAWLLVGCALLMAAHSSLTAYAIHIVRRVGAAETAMGVSLAIAAFMELPAMSVFSRIHRRMSLETLLRLCAVFFAVRVVLYLLARSVWVVYLASALQFLNYGLFLPATVYYVSEKLDVANQNKGQSLFHIACAGLGAAMGLLISGLLLDRAGTDAMLLYLLGSAVAGCAVVFWATRPSRT